MEKQNNFEKDMQNLKEWQENQYSPGHYIGTGRVKRPILKLSKYPVWMIKAGMVGLISQVITLFVSDTPIKELLFPVFFSAMLLVGGILRIKGK